MHRLLLSMFSLALVLITTPAVSQVVQEAPNTPASEVRFTLAPADEFAGFQCTVWLADEVDPLMPSYGSKQFTPPTPDAAREVRSLLVEDATARGRTVRLVASAVGVRTLGMVRSQPFVLGDESDAVHTVRMPSLGALVLHLPAAALLDEDDEPGYVSTIPVTGFDQRASRDAPWFGGRQLGRDGWDGAPIETWRELRKAFPGNDSIRGLWHGLGFRDGDALRAVVGYLPVGEYWVWYTTESGETVPRKLRITEHDLVSFTPSEVRASRRVVLDDDRPADTPEERPFLLSAWYRSRVGEILQASYDFGDDAGPGGAVAVPAWADEVLLIHVSLAGEQDDRMRVDLTRYALPGADAGDEVVVALTTGGAETTTQLPVLPVDAEQWHVAHLFPVGGAAVGQAPLHGFELVLPNNYPCTLRGFPRGTYRLVRHVPQGDFRNPPTPPDKVFRDQIVIE